MAQCGFVVSDGRNTVMTLRRRARVGAKLVVMRLAILKVLVFFFFFRRCLSLCVSVFCVKMSKWSEVRRSRVCCGRSQRE